MKHLGWHRGRRELHGMLCSNIWAVWNAVEESMNCMEHCRGKYEWYGMLWRKA
jgi:hypothetical protein